MNMLLGKQPEILECHHVPDAHLLEFDQLLGHVLDRTKQVQTVFMASS